MALTHISHQNASVGMRVQDYWGRTGTIRWIGKIEKKSQSPTNQTGWHYGIEYDEESKNPLRSNGTWNDKQYFTCPPRNGMLGVERDFYPEVNGKYVKLLREKFGDQVATWHDFELVKFCIARNYDMTKVIEMLKKHLKWREEFKPSCDEYFPPSMAEDYSCGYTGTADYDENLIFCEKPMNNKSCPAPVFVEKYTLPVICRWHIAGIEMGLQYLRESNYHYKRMCYIVDLQNLTTFSRAMVTFAQKLSSIEQDNYPEMAGRVIMVNCPTFFRVCWKLFQLFINERTNQKIRFVPPGKGLEVLSQMMAVEDIPDFCGGPSRKWIETNGGRLGSSDPTKVYKIGSCNVSDPGSLQVKRLENSPNMKDEDRRSI
ncbi:unnamed protein product [Phytomonas sp. EM1]|nr:unnamed protein product [Phytomonas sp. EM1]|eukprot:CCW59946.1 unnamed protein product [Phytomonas sp. isolate EM1]